MPLFCDTVIIFVILTILLRDTRRGFLSSFSKTAGRVLPLLLAFSLAGIFATLFERLFLYDLVYEHLSDALPHTDSASQALTGEIPLWLSALSFLGGVSGDLLSEAASDRGELIASIARPLAHGLASVIAFFFLLILFSLAMRSLIPSIVTLVHKIPAMGFFDTVLGFFFGVLHALLIGYLIALPLGALLGDSLPSAPIVAFLTAISPMRMIAMILLR